LRQAEQVAHRVVPGEAAHRPGVLAGHDAEMRPVDQEPRDISGGELRLLALDLQVGIHWQAAEPVACDGEARRERMGLHLGYRNQGRRPIETIQQFVKQEG
jgi:hypothetical protein